jgi:hypothetical protein
MRRSVKDCSLYHRRRAHRRPRGRAFQFTKLGRLKRLAVYPETTSYSPSPPAGRGEERVRRADDPFPSPPTVAHPPAARAPPSPPLQGGEGLLQTGSQSWPVERNGRLATAHGSPDSPCAGRGRGGRVRGTGDGSGQFCPRRTTESHSRGREGGLRAARGTRAEDPRHRQILGSPPEKTTMRLPLKVGARVCLEGCPKELEELINLS